MLTQFIQNPQVPAVCLHNTRQWQVSELMGGLACELLLKTRDIDRAYQREQRLPAHACYPSVFMQGDEADTFLTELKNAQAKHSPKDIDQLLLDGYSTVVGR